MTRTPLAKPEWLITLGSSLFVLVLAVFAVLIPEIRWLHVAQALVYVFAVFLSLRQRPWGYFVGASVGLFWDAVGMFGSPLFAELIAQPTRPDLLIQALAWLANLAVVVGSVLGYRRLPSRSPGDVGRFVLAFAATTAFLVGATAILAPSYLSHLAGILHPHWPWSRS